MAEGRWQHELIEVDDGVYVHAAVVDGVEGPEGAAAGAPLVFIHGNRDNHTHFLPLLGLLRGRAAVMVDLRGHGLSSPLRVSASPEVFACDVQRVLDHLGIGKAVFVGHSLGSVIAMTVAGFAPERVAALVLMGTAATFELSFKRPAMQLTEESFPAFTAEANRRAGPVFFTAEHPDVAARVLATWSTMSFESHRHLVMMSHPDLRAAVPALPGPVLVVAGEHDRCTPVASAQWIAQHHPRAQLLVVPSTGHFMYLEKPGVVADAIDGFLAGRQNHMDQ